MTLDSVFNYKSSDFPCAKDAPSLKTQKLVNLTACHCNEIRQAHPCLPPPTKRGFPKIWCLLKGLVLSWVSDVDQDLFISPPVACIIGDAEASCLCS